MPRAHIETRNLDKIGFSQYSILSTGEIVKYSNDRSGVITINPRKYRDDYIVKLENDNKEEQTLDYLMLYYKTFNNVNSRLELRYKVELIDDNINNLSLNNLKLTKIKKLTKEYYDVLSININKTLYVIKIIEYFRKRKDLEAVREKYDLTNKAYMFFVSLLPKMKEYAKQCDDIKYQYVKHLRKQIEVIMSLIDAGIKPTAKKYRIPLLFLKEVNEQKKWKLSNWLIYNYDKYENIF